MNYKPCPQCGERQSDAFTNCFKCGALLSGEGSRSDVRSSAGLAAPKSDSADMWVVYRRKWSGPLLPVVAFITKEMAEDWVAECPHRNRDIIEPKKVTFSPPTPARVASERGAANK